MWKHAVRRLLASIALLGFAGASQAAPALQLDVYNPGATAAFPVTSVLVSGEKEAILVDAQFARPEAAKLVERIRQSGKRLTTIYISHGDPDYYFGLQTLNAAFPQARIVASAPTVAHIKATMAAKMAYWGPQMGDDAPQKLIVPEVMQGTQLTLEGRELQVIGLDGPQAQRSFVWIPSIKAVVGGAVLSNNIHVWMADTQSEASHQHWLATLDTIVKLGPVTVVPGHFLPGKLKAVQAAEFTAGYIKSFDVQAAKAKDAAALIASMKALYPDLGEVSSLELSAKVAKGEQQW
ncbi:MAG: MBL fold metallo-hydrolase [Janthinobacterium lividum]